MPSEGPGEAGATGGSGTAPPPDTGTGGTAGGPQPGTPTGAAPAAASAAPGPTEDEAAADEAPGGVPPAGNAFAKALDDPPSAAPSERGTASLGAPTVVPLWPGDPEQVRDAEPAPTVIPVAPAPDVPASTVVAVATPVPPAARPPAPVPPRSDLGEEIHARLAKLEARVGETVDRLTEVVETQVPDAVERLRGEFSELRTELQGVLGEAAKALAEERSQLRSQIATTVGAANRWFVRTRDQLYERLDAIAQLAERAQAAGPAASAVTPGAAEKRAAATDAGFEWEVEQQGRAPAADRSAAATKAEGPEAGTKVGPEPEPGDPAPAAARVDLAIEAPELEALMQPVRVDVQDLQLEVSAMGDAVRNLAEQVENLRQRIPARARAVRLDPGQVDEIVDAVADRFTRPARATKATKAAKPAKAAKATKAAKAAKAPKTAK